MDFRHGWAIFGPLVDKNTRKGALVELSSSEKFSGRFWHDTSGLSFITGGPLPLASFPDFFFLNVLRYQLESWFIHSVGCTTYWVHVSPEWGSCDLLHVLNMGTINYQGIHRCWQMVGRYYTCTSNVNLWPYVLNSTVTDSRQFERKSQIGARLKHCVFKIHVTFPFGGCFIFSPNAKLFQLSDCTMSTPSWHTHDDLWCMSVWYMSCLHVCFIRHE